MNYLGYVNLCRKGQLWAGSQIEAQEPGPVETSEWSVLRGDLETATSAIADIADVKVAYLQAAKAARHFEDHSFMWGRSLPRVPTKDWLLPLLRAACSVAREHSDGERIERQAVAASRRNSMEGVRALIISSNAYRNVGSLDASRRLLLKAFQLALANTQQYARIPAPGFDRSFARRRQSAFHDLLQVSDFKRHSLFPCSGTLLGLFRDGDFIPSDGDIDIGCLDSSGFQALKAEIKSSGRFFLVPGRKSSNFTAKHVNGLKVDVSLYVPRDGGWAKTSHVYEWRFSSFGLGELVTDYGRLPVPEPTGKYLSAMYEDWWVARSGYDSRIDSQNVTYVCRDEVVIVLASHYLAKYLVGGEGACESWLEKFERLPVDMRDDVKHFLSRLA